ncbi:hypothetical protein EV182_002508, partial [Spiromyces aspiralis]
TVREFGQGGEGWGWNYFASIPTLTKRPVRSPKFPGTSYRIVDDSRFRVSLVWVLDESA